MKHFLFPIIIVLVSFSVPAFSYAADGVACTMQYQPVCGTENGAYKTYGNGCVLGAEEGIYQHEGECTQAELAGRQEGTYAPPAHCVAWNDGCNSCARQGNGQAACTVMACMGEPRAGFCTAYADAGEEADAPKPAAPGTISSEAAAGPADPLSEVAADATATATTTDAKPGFFTRIWTSVTAWFKSLF